MVMCWCRVSRVLDCDRALLVHTAFMLCLVGSSRCQLMQLMRQEGNGEGDVLVQVGGAVCDSVPCTR
jgi:hypothetical protein